MVLSSGFRKYLDLIQIFIILIVITISCQARVISFPRRARLSLDEPIPYYFKNNIDGQPGTYSYGYDVVDPATGNNQYKTEERYPNGTVVGTYGYVDAWGKPRRYKYVADERGYRVMRDPPYKPHRQQLIRPTNINPAVPEEPSITWTRPKKPNKKKNNKNNNNNIQINRPVNNFIGPPSSYIED